MDILEIEQYPKLYREQMNNKDYQKLIHVAENILLRPNDMKKWFGESKCKLRIFVFEEILENYKGSELYNYYYGLPKIKHGFCTFGRWKNKMYN